MLVLTLPHQIAGHPHPPWGCPVLWPDSVKGPRTAAYAALRAIQGASVQREHERGDDRPPRGRTDGLRADGEGALSHSEEWVHFLRECCAGCPAAAGRVRGHVIH